MKDNKIRIMVGIAMFTALCTAATLALRVPSPMGGYVNLGDVFVLMAGWILGPVGGACAAGVGSALADIVSGCAYFAPGTLAVKAGIALLAAFVGRRLYVAFGQKLLAALVFSAVIAELWMIVGYFGYTSLLLGRGWSALASVPGNLVQGGTATVASVLLLYALTAVGDFKERVFLLRGSGKEDK